MFNLFNHKPKRVVSLNEALALFGSLELEGGKYSRATRRHYLSDIRVFTKYLENIKINQVADVTLSDLRSYEVFMQRSGYATSSRQRKTHAIKAFFSFLEDRDLISHNPAGEFIPPSVQKDGPRILTDQEREILLSAAKSNPRDLAILKLFLDTGIKLSELSSLTITDVSLPETGDPNGTNFGQVRVKRKSTHESIPLSYEAWKAIDEYLAVRPSVPHMGLFVNRFDETMGARGIQNVIRKYMEQGGIEGASAHTLRHTMATRRLTEGQDLEALQEMMGHASLKTTSVYASLAKETQKESLQ